MFGWGKKKKVAKEETSEEKSARIRAEAMTNVRQAREAIGDEALDKISELMKKKEEGSAAIDRARASLDKASKERITDSVRSMMRDE